MSDDPDTKVYTADPYNPQALAREAVEAMRAAGPVSPELERTILGGARRFKESTTDLYIESPTADE